MRHRAGLGAGPPHASFTIAITMPMSTNTMIAICIQIHVGDISAHQAYAIRPAPSARSFA